MSFYPVASDKTYIGHDFCLLTPNKNQPPRIFVFQQLMKIYRETFFSFRRRQHSIAQRFYLVPQDKTPSRPLFVLCRLTIFFAGGVRKMAARHSCRVKPLQKRFPDSKSFGFEFNKKEEPYDNTKTD
jgi:hypothetical protein